MKTVTLEELKISAEGIVRGAASERTLVTVQGEVVAEIRAVGLSANGRRFPPGHWDAIPRPRIDVDSTAIVSADRDS